MTLAARQAPAFSEVTSATSITCTLGETPLSGSLITIQYFLVTAASPTISGGGVGTWTTFLSDSSSGATLATRCGFVTGTPSSTVTVTFGTTEAYAEIVGGEFTGVASASDSNTNSGSGASFSPPSLMLSGAGSLVLQSALATGGVTGDTPSGFTNVFNPVGAFSVYAWQICPGNTYTPESYLQGSSSWYAQAAAFGPTAPAGGIGIAGYPSVVGQSVKRTSLY